MAHADYACCACCDSKVYYQEDSIPKEVLCEVCSKNISDIANKPITTVSQFKELIEKYSDKDSLFLFLKNIGFHFCFYTNQIDKIVSEKVGYEYTKLIKNNYNLPAPMKIIIIEAKGKYYISDDLTGRQIHSMPGRITPLGNMYIDGHLPEIGLAGGWYCVDSIPQKIQEFIPETKNNYVWKLKDNLKETIIQEYHNIPEEIYGEYFPEEYEEVKFAYLLHYDIIEEHLKDVSFELITLESDGNYIPKYISFTPFFSVKDMITTPKVLLLSKPCAVSGKELYKLIRDHVKRNINPKVAKITADYDFCFTVEKIIDIEPYKIQYNVSKTKTPRYQEKLITQTNLVIYKNSPDGYHDYPKQEDWFANSCEEMQEKIDNFLTELINKINTPVKQCPTCKGYGVIQQEEL